MCTSLDVILVCTWYMPARQATAAGSLLLNFNFNMPPTSYRSYILVYISSSMIGPPLKGGRRRTTATQSNAPQHPGSLLRVLHKRQLVREGERRHLPERARQHVKHVLQERHVPKRKLRPRHRPRPRKMRPFLARRPRWCNGDRRQRKFVHARPRRHLG